ncbi:hypothetical protein ACLQ2Q_09040 [Microbacterium sp. DT81.1]|uniref:hypothetical protein n=1 Tax=Microbacterium sp. DT81.1 TaxID=3393413 RepID=UPI003CEE5AE7
MGDGVARRAVLSGGAATVVVAMAFVGAVSTAHAITLKDSSGVPAGRPVVVPFNGSTVDQERVPRLAPRVPEVVPAPDPLDIAASRATDTTPIAPVAQPVDEAEPVVTNDTPGDVPVEAERRSNVAEELRSKVDAELRSKVEAELRSRLEAELRSKDVNPAQSDVPDFGRHVDPQTPAKAGSPSGHDSPKSWSGLKKEKSPVVPDPRD